MFLRIITLHNVRSDFTHMKAFKWLKLFLFFTGKIQSLKYEQSVVYAVCIHGKAPLPSSL